jgi:hypothetical protein
MDVNGGNANEKPTFQSQKKAFELTDVGEAVQWVRNDFQIRQIDDVIREAVKKKAESLGITEEEMEKRLRFHLSPDSRIMLDGLINGEIAAITRDFALVIAFGLSLTSAETEGFLYRCWQEGFYMRDIKDIVYRHGLDKGWTYEETRQLIEEMEPFIASNDSPQPDATVPQGNFTEYLAKQYAENVGTKEELVEFIKENAPYFGTFKRKAYERFKEYYDELKSLLDWQAQIDYKLDKKDDDKRDERNIRVPMAEVCNMIVQSLRDIPADGALGANIRQLITANLPGRAAMSEIINKYERNGRVTQVDRKLLLLAYLASGAGDKKEHNEDKKDEALMEHILEINDELLVPLGMATLDALHPFDWILMNALCCVYYMNEDTGERFNDLVAYMKEIAEENAE